MQRGVRQKEVFCSDFDRKIFLDLLRSTIEKYGGRVHAYALMTNHYHLLFETDEHEIWKIMKSLVQNYAKKFNREHSYCGHVFEDRYKSYLVKTDKYFLQTSRYINLNPVKAGIVAKPENYRWSSYNTLIGTSNDKLTFSDKTMSYFSPDSRLKYKAFVEDSGDKYYDIEDEISKSVGDGNDNK